MKREGWTECGLSVVWCGYLCSDRVRAKCDRRGRCLSARSVSSLRKDADAYFRRCRRVSVEVKEVKGRR
jgi:hypothetical protein